MMTDLLLCLLALVAQLAVLHYLDLRVAAMPRLAEADPVTPLPVIDA